MHRPILLIIIIGLGFAKVEVTFWRTQHKKLTQGFEKKLPLLGEPGKQVVDTHTARFKTAMIRSFLNMAEFKDITFDQLMGQGSYGTVYRGERNGSKEPVSLKVMWETSDRMANCNDAYNAYKKLADAGVKYLIKTEAPVPAQSEERKLYLCGSLMEFASPTTIPMFTDKSTAEIRAQNSREMVGFLERLFFAFFQIHHRANIYHADIKPDNILWKRTINGIEPRVIDFDLVFTKKSPHFNPRFIIYTLDYRPPELKAIVPQTNPTAQQKLDLATYRYDADFREEVWALGVTMLDILDLNDSFLDTSDSDLRYIQDEVIPKMTKDNIKERICSEEAYLLVKSRTKGAKAATRII